MTNAKGLKAERLCKSFGSLRAVSNLSLTVTTGTIVGIVGPNGAGKTTLLDLLTGVQRPDSGLVFLDGNRIDVLPRWKIARSGLARTFQEVRLFREMTTVENVLLSFPNLRRESLGMALLGDKGHSSAEMVAKAYQLLMECGLSGTEKMMAEWLSYGQQKLLAICCCVATGAKTLLLDEPVAGVQPAMVKQMSGVLRQIVLAGHHAVLVVEHDLDFVANTSDRVAVLDGGAIVAEGAPDDVASDRALVRAYLS